ncbi:hypothetical protein MASR2M39_22550 [Ignavibacteriales bacterium]
MEIIMKKLFIILLVFNSVLFSQWESAVINPLSGQVFSFHMISDSLNFTAAYSDDSCVKTTDGVETGFAHRESLYRFKTEASVIDENYTPD